MSKDDFIKTIFNLMPTVSEKEMNIILYDLHD